MSQRSPLQLKQESLTEHTAPRTQPHSQQSALSDTAGHSRIISGANIITFLRFLLVPVILYGLLNSAYEFTLIAFCIAALTDGLDGLLARTLSLRTRMGAYMDPMADKFLLMSTFICLSYLGEVPVWFTSCAILRDMLIISGVTLLTFKNRNLMLSPSLISKINTLFELALVFFVLMRLADITHAQELEQLIIYITLGTLVLSSISYAKMGYCLYKGQPSVNS